MQNPILTQYGNIDVYLFDQLLKGRFHTGQTFVDVGCGRGRNLFWLLENGAEVYGFDPNPEAISAVRELAASLRPDYPADRFREGPAESDPFAGQQFDVVICNAVLHFARDEAHFEQMADACWKLVKPGGFFFARLATDIGIEDRVKQLGRSRFLLPDGSERYLSNLDQLLRLGKKWGAFQIEPIKTTNVQNLRCMTTWVLEKPSHKQSGA